MPGKGMEDEATRKTLMGLMATLTPDKQFIDAQAFVTWLDAQPAVNKQRKIGTAGYSMGGPLTMRTAATFPDRVGAAHRSMALISRMTLPIAHICWYRS